MHLRDETIAAVAKYGAHWAIATYGLVLFSFIVGFFFELLVRDHHRFVDYFIVGPSFALPGIIGILGGYYAGRYLPSKISRFIWLPALLILISECYFDYKYRSPGTSYWSDIWNNYIGAECGGSECLGELVCTAPLVSALAYAVGAELGRLKEIRSSRLA
jgi:hypothetical protein